MIDPAILEHYAYDPETGAFTWAVDYCGGRYKAGTPAGFKKRMYHALAWKGQYIAGHRLAFYFMTGSAPDGLVDHINGNPSDNRWCNLRSVTNSVNSQNRRKLPNASGSTGVILHKSGKWQAQIGAGRKRYYLGLFDDVASAHAAYTEAKTRLHDGLSFRNVETNE